MREYEASKYQADDEEGRDHRGDSRRHRSNGEDDKERGNKSRESQWHEHIVAGRGSHVRHKNRDTTSKPFEDTVKTQLASGGESFLVAGANVLL